MKKNQKNRIRKYGKYAKEEIDEIVSQEPLEFLILKFFTPWIIGILVCIGILFVDKVLLINMLKLAGAYMFNPFGTVIGVPTAFKLGLNKYIAFSFMLFLDALASMFIIWNLDFVKVLPLIGRFVNYVIDRTESMLKKKPWIRKVAFVGVFTFVLMPFYMTGSILGSLIGRLISLEPYKIWIAVMLGSLVRLSLYFMFLNGLVYIFL